MHGGATPEQMLAMVEAEVGSLVEVLPVPIIVTSEAGYILRANAEAGAFLDLPESLVGKHIQDVLRAQAVSVRMRRLDHYGSGLHLYVLQHRTEAPMFSHPQP